MMVYGKVMSILATQIAKSLSDDHIQIKVCNLAGNAVVGLKMRTHIIF